MWQALCVKLVISSPSARLFCVDPVLSRTCVPYGRGNAAHERDRSGQFSHSFDCNIVLAIRFFFSCPSLALRRRCWKPATRLLAKNATSLPSRMACCVTGTLTRTRSRHPLPLPRLPQPTFSTWRFLAFKSTTRVLRSFRL